MLCLCSLVGTSFDLIWIEIAVSQFDLDSIRPDTPMVVFHGSVPVDDDGLEDVGEWEPPPLSH